MYLKKARLCGTLNLGMNLNSRWNTMPRKEQRGNAIKAYMEKNGKKIKRSAAALALAGLTTLSATTMSGCEEIVSIINPNLGLEDNRPTGEHYIVPTMRSDDEIQETGITAQDVLALYDNLTTNIIGVQYAGLDFLNEDYYPDGKKYSASFVSIDTKVGWEDRICPVYGITQRFDDFPKWFNRDRNDPIIVDDMYDIGIHYNGIDSHNVIYNDECLNTLIDKSLFEPLAESLGHKKFLLTEEKDQEYWYETGYIETDFYIDTNVYERFTITRETIENATDEQLELLYSIGKSIWDFMFNLNFPDKSNSNDDTVNLIP